MSPALLSVIALVAAIAISFASRLNVGLVAIPLAWAVGAYGRRSADAVLSGFPAGLFLTLAGVTLLFALAETNGTIAALATRLMRAARGRSRLLPAITFAIACAISTAGPGAIPATALIAPLGLALAAPAMIPPFLTALMVANGANAGNLSPVSAVGIIANSRMDAVGLGGHQWKVWAANFIAHLLVAGVAYAFLIRRVPPAATMTGTALPPMTAGQWITAAVIACWIAAVMALGAPIALASFAAGALLIAVRAGTEKDALRAMPWGAILMVSGMTMLVATVERVGGLDLFTSLLATVATPATLNGVIAFVTGAISTASSTSGVVLPTFLPMSPGLVQQAGGGDPLAVALSINVGASLVDVSPLSTIGAICVAAAAAGGDTRPDLFRRMLIWGLSMTVVGALLCQLFAGWLARL